jgi:hypothetical protein
LDGRTCDDAGLALPEHHIVDFAGVGGTAVKGSRIDGARIKGEDTTMMQYLRDRTGSIIGFTQQFDDRIQLHDRTGSVCGWYQIKTDITFDRKGSVAGYGNLLGMLLACQDDPKNKK